MKESNRYMYIYANFLFFFHNNGTPHTTTTTPSLSFLCFFVSFLNCKEKEYESINKQYVTPGHTGITHIIHTPIIEH